MVQITEYRGPRSAVRSLFELAESSAAKLDSYIASGRVLVAMDDDHVVGHLQLVETDRSNVVELKSMAVAESHQARGIGRKLVLAAFDVAREESRATMIVATAAADTGNLRFYQRLGFRMLAIERDAFTEANGYSPDLTIDGILLRDRVWLDCRVPG